MPPINRALRDLAGYPLQIALHRLDYSRGAKSHFERLLIMDFWYSGLRSYLPEFMGVDVSLGLEQTDKKAIIYIERILPRLDALNTKLIEVWHSYQQRYDSEDSFSPDELTFVISCRSAIFDLDEITAICKIIDKSRLDEIEEIG